VRLSNQPYRAGDQEANTLQRAQDKSTQDRLLERAQARRATARSLRDRRVVEQSRNKLAQRSASAARQATIDAIQNISQRVSQCRSLSGNREVEGTRSEVRRYALLYLWSIGTVEDLQN